MTIFLLRRIAAFGIVACLSALTSSCRLFPVSAPVNATVRPRSTSPARLVQLDFGGQTIFVRCQPPACPTRTPKTLALDAPSQPLDSALSLTPDSASIPEPETTDSAQTSTATRMVTVQFPFASATLSTLAQARLDDAFAGGAAVLGVAITGRTDNSGPLTRNQTLARARAHAVRDYLLQAHPPLAAVLTVQAQGGCCFIATNATPDGRAQNRRVEVTLQIEER